MKKIELTQGRFAIVDDNDFERLSRYSWYYQSEGYAARRNGRRNGHKLIYMHKVVLGTDKEVDHKNLNRLDNRKSNLRVCDRSLNMGNSKSRGGSSMFKGVTFNKRARKWIAQITVKRQPIFLGYFYNEEDAARAYDERAREYYGDFGRYNFPVQGERSAI